MIEIPGLSTAHGEASSIDTTLIYIIILLQFLQYLHNLLSTYILMIIDGNKEEILLMSDLPPACGIGKVHSRISATMESQHKRHRTVIKESLIIICEVTYCMLRLILKFTYMIR